MWNFVTLDSYSIDQLCSFNENADFYGTANINNKLIKINGEFDGDKLKTFDLKYNNNLFSFTCKIQKNIKQIKFGTNIKKIKLINYNGKITCENTSIKNKKTINKKHFYFARGVPFSTDIEDLKVTSVCLNMLLILEGGWNLRYYA